MTQLGRRSKSLSKSLHIRNLKSDLELRDALRGCRCNCERNDTMAQIQPFLWTTHNVWVEGPGRRASAGLPNKDPLFFFSTSRTSSTPAGGQITQTDDESPDLHSHESNPPLGVKSANANTSDPEEIFWSKYDTVKPSLGFFCGLANLRAAEGSVGAPSLINLA